MIKKSWITTEECRYWVLFPKFWKSVFSHMFSLFFSLSFTIYWMLCKGALVCYQPSYIHTWLWHIKALDEKYHLDAVLLDYSKAFDSVSFNCLLRELFAIGVRGNLLSWFRTELLDRSLAQGSYWWTFINLATCSVWCTLRVHLGAVLIHGVLL